MSIWGGIKNKTMMIVLLLTGILFSGGILIHPVQAEEADKLIEERLGYYGDDSLYLHVGEQVSGSQTYTDMNSAYAYALQLLTEKYGIGTLLNEELTSMYSDSGSMMGIGRADLFGINAAGNPYLVVKRNVLEGGVSEVAYIFSWEQDKLIFKGIPTGAGFFLSIPKGRPAVVTDDDCGGACIFFLDGTDDKQFYGIYDFEEEVYNEATGEDEYRYYIGDHIGTLDELNEVWAYLQCSRVDWSIMRGYMTTIDSDVKFISSPLDEIYSQGTGGQIILPAVDTTKTWQDYYRWVIDQYAKLEDARFGLLFIDSDNIPELIVQQYSGDSTIVFSSDGKGLETARISGYSTLYTQDRCGSFLLMRDETEVKDPYAYSGFLDADYGLFSLSAGRIHLLSRGDYYEYTSYDSYDNETIHELNMWNGNTLSDFNTLVATVSGSLPGSVMFYPYNDAAGVFSMIDTISASSMLSVNSSWTKEAADSFHELWKKDRGDYDYPEEDYYYNENYEEEDNEDVESDYASEAEAAENESDWEAVNEADLEAGDPVTMPADLFADNQEHYKETGYLLPQSATKYLTEADIAHLTMKGCCYARNEIFARYGREFASEELRNFFNSLSWYDGVISPDAFDEAYMQSTFNEYEYQNAYFLLEYENAHGMYMPK